MYTDFRTGSMDRRFSGGCFCVSRQAVHGWVLDFLAI